MKARLIATSALGAAGVLLLLDGCAAGVAGADGVGTGAGADTLDSDGIGASWGVAEAAGVLGSNPAGVLGAADPGVLAPADPGVDPLVIVLRRSWFAARARSRREE